MSLISNKKVDTNTCELEIKVSEQDFKNEINKVFKKNSKTIQIAGFRKGKAPRSVVEKMYGKEVFWEEAVNGLYPKYYDQVIKEENIDAVALMDIEVTQIDDNGFTFVAKVITKPEVEVSTYKGVKVEKVCREASEEDINNRLAQMQNRNSRNVSVSDRAVEDGDIVNINFEGFKDGVAFDGGKGEDYDLTIGSNSFIPGFEEQIIGHSIDEEFEINVNFPEEYHQEELKGQAAVFKIKINSISKTELPELDDEFAKDVSEFDTLAELKEDIKKQIQEDFDQKSERDLKDRIVDKIVEGVTGEIPEVMYDQRINEMVENFKQMLQQNYMNLETYLQYTGSNMDAFRKTFRAEAERIVKMNLALEKIAGFENISASAEEIEAEYSRLAENYKLAVDEIKKYIPEKDVLSDLSTSKAMTFLVEQAEISEISAEEFEKREEAKKAEEEKASEAKSDKEKKPAKTTKAKAEKDTKKSDDKPKKETKKTTKKKTEKKEEENTAE